MRATVASAVAGMVLLSAGAWAQSANSGVIPALGAGSTPVTSATTRTLPPMALPAVSGLPYTLEQTQTTERTLADGTHITNERKTKMVRDSDGRTCTIFFNKIGDRSSETLFIEDPLAHERIMLNGWDKTAEVTHTRPIPAPHPLTPEQKAALETARAKAVANADVPPQKSSSPNSENLGSQSIQGIYVEGRRMTTVIPVGQMGNDRELRRVIENWFSPELKISMEQTNDDPINGKSTTKVTSINRGDPDPGLFRVPEGYKVIDKNPEATTAQP